MRLPILTELLEGGEAQSDAETDVVIDESVPTENEVRNILGQLKNRRCRGIDGVWGEQLKYGLDSQLLITTLITLLQLIWFAAKVPLLWTKSTLSCIFKNKGSAREAKNYRAISVTATLCRIFSQVFLNRVRCAYNAMLGETQCGF